MNILEQMDVEEFFNNFMDKLETQLKGTPQEQLVKQDFGGTLVTECIGKDACAHHSERNEPCLSVQLQVKNKKSIHEGLEDYVEGDLLENDNAYQCDFCETKVTALRRVCIKYLPNTLVLVLRRFEFDFDTMNRVKVNDYCEFPFELDMEPYTQEGLQRRELTKQRDKALSEDKEPAGEVPEQKHPADYYLFELRGILVHIGTAESGHYYSIIKDRAQDQ